MCGAETIVDWQQRGITARVIGLRTDQNPLLQHRPQPRDPAFDDWMQKSDAWLFGWNIEDSFRCSQSGALKLGVAGVVATRAATSNLCGNHEGRKIDGRNARRRPSGERSVDVSGRLFPWLVDDLRWHRVSRAWAPAESLKHGKDARRPLLELHDRSLTESRHSGNPPVRGRGPQPFATPEGPDLLPASVSATKIVIAGMVLGCQQAALQPVR